MGKKDDYKTCTKCGGDRTRSGTWRPKVGVGEVEYRYCKDCRRYYNSGRIK